jgi:two-component system sensor histidine kinase/response regulator
MDRAILDLEASLVRLGDDRGLLKKLVEFFFEDAPQLMEQLEAGVAAGNAANVERAAHSLKGLAGNFNALPAVDAALRLEEIGGCGDLSHAKTALTELQFELQRLYEALREHR